MSALLKSGDATALSAVRPLGAVPRHRNHALDLQSLPGADTGEDASLERERDELAAAIAQLSDQLAEAQADADAREDAAFARGKREGEDLATGETDKRLELLRAGLESARQTHLSQLGGCELLALQLARTAIGRLFADETLHAELLSETIARTLASTKRELVLGLRVSPRDFGAGDLCALEAEFSGFRIELDEALEAGGCAIDLRLGTIDLGLPGQWQRLSAFFEGLAQGREAS